MGVGQLAGVDEAFGQVAKFDVGVLGGAALRPSPALRQNETPETGPDR